MAATALAQEKVWFEKPLYDKAARLHFERLAKVVADKILEQQYEPNPKSLITSASQELAPAVIAINDQTVNSSKKSKDKNGKAAKKHKNMKKSKSDAVDIKEHITATQESQQSICPIIPASGSLANEIAKARQHIKKSLQCMNGIAACTDVSLQDVVARVATLEKDNQELRNTVDELKNTVKELQSLVFNNSWPRLCICPAKPPDAEPAVAPKAGNDDDDVDLFGSDSEGEDAEAAKIREERLAAYAAKKIQETGINRKIKHHSRC